jgi:hypothetical protein
VPAATLLASAVLAGITGAGFASVGWVLTRRAAPEKGRAARIMFCLFWYSAAVIFACQGLQNLAAGLGAPSFGLVSALDQATTPFYCLAAAGLLYYSLFLVTGRERLLFPILGYYLVLFVALRWRIEDARRLGVVTGDWFVGFEYASPLQGPVYTALVALVALPLLVAIVAYATLYFRVDDRAAKYRILLTTLGLFVWILTEALAYTSGFASTTAGEVTRRLVALASTVIVLFAYRPPRLAQRWWGARAAE